MRTFLISVIVAALSAAASQAAVLSGPIVNPANGHTYYLLSQNTWSNSEKEAQALGGHLATINDSAENDWVYETFGGAKRNLWIGLSDVATEGTFVWADGSSSAFTNWEVGQPKEPPGVEQDVVCMMSELVVYPGFVGRKWDDTNSAQTVVGNVGIFGVVEVVPAKLSDFMSVIVDRTKISTTDEGLELTNDGHLNSAREYKVPLRIDIVAKTNSTNVRLYFGPKGVAIFNWEVNQDELRFEDPVDGKGKHQAGQGRIPVNEWVTFTWIITDNNAKLLVNDKQRASIPGNYRGLSSPVGIGPGHGSVVVLKSIKIKSNGIEDGAGPGVSASAELKSAKYPAPDLAAPIFNTQKLKLPIDQRKDAAQALTDYVAGTLPLETSDGLAMASRMLGIALRLESANRNAVILNAKLRRGDAPVPATQPATASGDSAKVLSDKLIKTAQACQTANTEDDRILAAYLYSLILAVDPKNEEAIFQGEQLSQNGVLVTWEWAGGPSVSRATDKPVIQPGDANTTAPIVRRQNSIKGLAVVSASNGQLVGVSSDVIVTVLASEGRANGVRFMRDAGEDMRTALDEAVRTIRVRYPKWEDGDIQLSFEDKYSKQDGGSAGTAFAVLLLSLFDGFEIDPAAAITGDITVDWKTRKIGGVDAKIRAAVNAGSKYVTIPAENTENIDDYLVLNGPKALWEIQIFAASTLVDAVRIVRKDRDTTLADAIRLFEEVKADCQKSPAYLSNPAAKEKLDRILSAAPNHLSAKYLRMITEKKQPIRLSTSMSLYQAFVAMYPLRDYLFGNELPRKNSVSDSTVNDIRRQLRDLRRNCSEKVVPLLSSMQEFTDSVSKTSSPDGRQNFQNRRTAVVAELERLQARKETFEELIRRGI